MWPKAEGLLPATIAPTDFAADYRFYDDGWTGTLSLDRVSNGRVVGTYHSDRFGEDYTVRADVGDQFPHRIKIVIDEYNWMPAQEFDGYLFTQGMQAIAGVTVWNGTPFGFLAWKGQGPVLGRYGRGSVRVDDFAGSYRVELDGERGELTLVRRGDVLEGLYQDQRGLELPVVAEVDRDVPHRVQIRVRGPEELLLRGLLFSRPKNAIVGSYQLGGTPFAFSMLKYR